MAKKRSRLSEVFSVTVPGTGKRTACRPPPLEHAWMQPGVTAWYAGGLEPQRVEIAEAAKLFPSGECHVKYKRDGDLMVYAANNAKRVLPTRRLAWLAIADRCRQEASALTRRAEAAESEAKKEVSDA